MIKTVSTAMAVASPILALAIYATSHLEGIEGAMMEQIVAQEEQVQLMEVQMNDRRDEAVYEDMPETIVEPVKKEEPKTIMNVTAYTAGYESTGKTPDHPDYGKTSSGAYVEQGVTIAAGKNIPFGTKIYIPYFDGKSGFGNGIFTVQDRGGAIGPNNIDVYMKSLSKANEFGRQNLEVKILEDEK